jgi:hypothetical protein
MALSDFILYDLALLFFPACVLPYGRLCIAGWFNNKHYSTTKTHAKHDRRHCRWSLRAVDRNGYCPFRINQGVKGKPLRGAGGALDSLICSEKG